MRFAILLVAIIQCIAAQQTACNQCDSSGWTGPASKTPTVSSTSTAAAALANFTNPVIYEDFADNDIFLGPNNTFYFMASNMHYDPGAPILRSYDLVNWEWVGHAVPSLGVFGSQYNMTGNTTAYREGTWASTMRYRQSDATWYWIGCIDFWVTYIYTAPAPDGPWTQSASMSGNCYYDCGLLIDDDDTMYVVYGNTNVSIAQLSPDGLSQVKSQQVFNASEVNRTAIEGNRLYKKDGIYYVLDDDTQGTTIIWKSSSIWGPWTPKILQDGISSPVPGGYTVDQGSLIETQNGDWYFMSFTWAYPAGRMPILAPITWGSDGYPTIVTDSSGGWGATYPMPLPAQPLSSWTGTDTFQGSSLGPPWEWNQNPDTTKFSVNNSLTLQTATVTDDLFHARNTLTHRPNGPTPVGTVAINFANMADGDICGLAAFRDGTSWIGVQRNGSSYQIQMRFNATQDQSSWATISTGTVADTAPVAETKVWFRVTMDSTPESDKLSHYYYSTDGTNFTQLGPSYPLNTDYQYFMGYRFAIFNFATKALGGSVQVTSFTSA